MDLSWVLGVLFGEGAGWKDGGGGGGGGGLQSAARSRTGFKRKEGEVLRGTVQWWLKGLGRAWVRLRKINMDEKCMTIS